MLYIIVLLLVIAIGGIGILINNQDGLVAGQILITQNQKHLLNALRAILTELESKRG